MPTETRPERKSENAEDAATKETDAEIKGAVEKGSFPQETAQAHEQKEQTPETATENLHPGEDQRGGCKRRGTETTPTETNHRAENDNAEEKRLLGKIKHAIHDYIRRRQKTKRP